MPQRARRSPVLTPKQLDDIRRQYEDFSDPRVHGSAKLYGYIGQWQAQRSRVGAGYGVFRWVNPPHAPSAVFTASRYLLLKDTPGGEFRSHRFSRYFALPGEAPSAPPDVYAGKAFDEFCHDFGADLVDVMNSRTVAVNDVGRSTVNATFVSWVEQETGSQVAWIDPAACQGTTLLDFDELSHRINGQFVGRRDRPVIDSAIRFRPGIWGDFRMYVPRVNWKYGSDLHPILDDPDDMLYMRAAFWEGHSDREQLFDYTTRLLREAQPEIHQADIVELLAEAASGQNGRWGGALSKVPPDLTPVMSLGWILGWLPKERRTNVMQSCFEMGRIRPFYVAVFDQEGAVPLFSDGAVRENSYIGLLKFDENGVHEILSGRAHPHGGKAFLSANHTRMPISAKDFRTYTAGRRAYEQSPSHLFPGKPPQRTGVIAQDVPLRMIKGSFQPESPKRANELLKETLRDLWLLRDERTRGMRTETMEFDMLSNARDQAICLAHVVLAAGTVTPEETAQRCDIDITVARQAFDRFEREHVLECTSTNGEYQLGNRAWKHAADLIADASRYMLNVDRQGNDIALRATVTALPLMQAGSGIEV